VIFRRDFKAQKVETDLSDVKTLLEWLGVDPDAVNIKGNKALKEITFYSCVKFLADTVSKLPLKIYQESNGIKKATDHYLYSLLAVRPNPFMSPSDFWKCIEAQRSIRGNAFAWPDVAERGKNAGKITGIYPLNSSQMKIYVDDIGLISSKNSVWYVYTDNSGNQYKLQADEILHFKGLTTDGIAGLDITEILSNSLENAKSAEQYINNFFKNGMQTKGIVQYVGTLTPEAQKTFREKFEEMSNGLKNSHKISLLPIGYQFQPISMNLVDAQFLENTKLTIRQIAAAFGIKLHQINDLDRATFSNIEEQQREFYIDTLQAILKMYEDELRYKLFLDPEIMAGYYVKFNVDSILRGDTEKRYNAYAKAIQFGFKTPNECRAKEEDPPLEGGDKLYFNGSMIPITMAGKQYEQKGGSAGE